MTPAPKQVVFMLSNQPNNQVGVYESLPDGGLAWHSRVDTGGVGYPDDREDENPRQLDSLRSSNAVHYHAWNNSQWLVAANAGGPAGDASVSLFEIQPDLTMTLRDLAPLQGIFSCSATGFEDRVCALGCGDNVTMECFQISNEGTLVPEYFCDFGYQFGFPESRPHAAFGGVGPGNVLFSPSGDQVGTAMKGEGFNNTAQAGFVTFPALDRATGIPYAAEPTTFDLPNETIPFALAWRPGQNGASIAAVVNIAGESMDFSDCAFTELGTCRSSVTTIHSDLQGSGSSTSDTLTQVQDLPLDVIDGCWIEYHSGYFYTGNFSSDSVTVGHLSAEGSMGLTRTIPVGLNSVPNDLAILGAKNDGSLYLYTENQGIGNPTQDAGEVGIHKVIDGSFSAGSDGRTASFWFDCRQLGRRQRNRRD